MNVMTKAEMAKHLRGLADAPSLTIENRKRIQSIADELDPPKPKIDRTIRGLVEVKCRNGTVQAFYACDEGITERKGPWVGVTPWYYADQYIESIRPIRELKPWQVAVDKILIDRLLYYVDNPSAWETFDESVSDAIHRIVQRMEVSR